MGRTNFRGPAPETHRERNFTERLRRTSGSELEPEQVTPNTAGAEELPEYEEIFPLTRQFRQTNMHGSRGGVRSGSDDQRQSKDRRSENRKTDSLG
jgi:hypothetical protein